MVAAIASAAPADEEVASGKVRTGSAAGSSAEGAFPAMPALRR